MKFDIETLSINVGTAACDAHCPFCISHQTGFDEVPSTPKNSEIADNKFYKAAQYAIIGRCSNVLFTGKGEPTLYIDQVIDYLHMLRNCGYAGNCPFPVIEMQTNAIMIGQIAEAVVGKPDTLLQLNRIAATPGKAGTDLWGTIEGLTPAHYHLFSQLELAACLGMTTIAISTVGVNPEHNHQIYLNHRPNVKYPDLGKTVEFLHSLGYIVRLCVMQVKDMVDSPEAIEEVLEWCRQHGVEQSVIRPIKAADGREDTPEGKYVQLNGLNGYDRTVCREFFKKEDHIHTLMRGTAHEIKVFSVDGQNMALADCLTSNADCDTIRSVIYFGSSPKYPDGIVKYSWDKEGAILF